MSTVEPSMDRGRRQHPIGDGIYVAWWYGDCSWCTQEIRKGDYVRPGRDSQGEGWRHESCEDVQRWRARLNGLVRRLYPIRRVDAALRLRQP